MRRAVVVHGPEENSSSDFDGFGLSPLDVFFICSNQRTTLRSQFDSA